jgi:hypothetical protein
MSEGTVLGVHSMHHIAVYEQTIEEFEVDLVKNIETISSAANGQSIEYYRAPGFSLDFTDDEKIAILAKYGIKYDFSMFVGSHSSGALTSNELAGPYSSINHTGSITFFPNVSTKLSIYDIGPGGGYFRLLPSYLFISTLKGYDLFNSLYFHPKDFLSMHEIPFVSNFPFTKNIKAKIQIGNPKKKFIKLLSEVDVTNSHPHCFFSDDNNASNDNRIFM